MPVIYDLRSALAMLEQLPGQLLQTDEPVDPNADLAGIYKLIGAGGTVERPTRTGPAMIFNNVKGYADARVLVGLMASRERVAALLGAPAEELGIYLGKAVRNPIPRYWWKINRGYVRK
ncbi:UbiD family decarboxylase domain-containing protein [Paraflavitalea speifideaquila]|uniref:UbiD family decarboxylase domain-containing protein n=1 Tax=Paraflavitalea speifideaquila TaxID=3076558 RepID=UPI0028E84675|nr:UbiD family decarboxylase domain-containing protein [Paraflavitalea speifideiaquila]